MMNFISFVLNLYPFMLHATLRLTIHQVASACMSRSLLVFKALLRDAMFKWIVQHIKQRASGSTQRTATCINLSQLGLAGEHFMVFANGGQRPGVRVMRDIVESYFGSGMLYSNPPPDQRAAVPCDASATVFPSLKARSVQPCSTAGLGLNAKESSVHTPPR